MSQFLLYKWKCWESCLVKVKIFWDFWNLRSCADCQILDCFITFYEKTTRVQSQCKKNLFVEVPSLGDWPSAEKMGSPQTCLLLGWPSASLWAPGSAQVGLFPAWISFQNLSDQKWYSRKKPKGSLLSPLSHFIFVCPNVWLLMGTCPGPVTSALLCMVIMPWGGCQSGCVLGTEVNSNN